MALDHPWALVLLVACWPALSGRGLRWQGWASLATIPGDRLSVALDGALRGIAALAIAGTVLAVAGLHDGPGRVTRVGSGAHVVIALDRSLSMDEPFALRGEKSRESKAAAASRLLGEFVAGRPHDSVGVVAFSTSPIPAMPLTAHRAAVAATIRAMADKGLADTDIGAGIAMGLAAFDADPTPAARVLVLVSDGAGAIAERTRDYIRAAVQRTGAHVYYLYLRSGDDPPLQTATDESHDLEKPAGLSLFLQSLGTVYAGFEARDQDAVTAAIQHIGKLETREVTYQEPVKRQDRDQICNAIAAVCVAIGLLTDWSAASTNTQTKQTKAFGFFFSKKKTLPALPKSPAK